MNNRKKLWDLVCLNKEYYDELPIAINSILQTDQQVKEMIEFIEKNPSTSSSVLTLQALDIVEI